MSNAKVVIFLATYNGEKYLAEQLDSIINQSHEYWELWASDDGSTDATMEILQRYQEQLGREKMHILNGPQKGYALNFLSLPRLYQGNADYFAFCDQDDIWLKDKLTVALKQLDLMTQDKPILYCSTTTLVDAQGKLLQSAPYFNKKLSFQNALIQAIAGGNTMVFNKHTKDLLTKREQPSILSHDWWLYLLVTGTGGEIYYDRRSLIEYRQHDTNILGYKFDLKTRLKRFFLIFKGRMQHYNDANIKALLTVADLLTEKNKVILDHFILARKAPLLERLYRLLKIGVYNQNTFGNISLTIAALTKKL